MLTRDKNYAKNYPALFFLWIQCVYYTFIHDDFWPGAGVVGRGTLSRRHRRTHYSRNHRIQSNSERYAVSVLFTEDGNCDVSCELQWRLATMVTMSTNECQNIASAIVINFEECNVTLLQTRILKQSHVDQQTIKIRLNEIKKQSRSTQLYIC